MTSTFLTLLLLLAVPAARAGEAAQAAPDAPPNLVVLGLKSERRLDPSPRAGGTDPRASRTASDPDALNNPGGIQTSATSPFPPYVYQYSVEVRNDSARAIKWVMWDYVVSAPGGGGVSDRHRFVSAETIAPAKKKTLSGRTHAAPSRVVSAGASGKGGGAAYEARVEFRCVKYEDGTWWHHPSFEESLCAESEKRGK